MSGEGIFFSTEHIQRVIWQQVLKRETGLESLLTHSTFWD